MSVTEGRHASGLRRVSTTVYAMYIIGSSRPAITDDRSPKLNLFSTCIHV